MNFRLETLSKLLNIDLHSFYLINILYLNSKEQVLQLLLFRFIILFNFSSLSTIYIINVRFSSKIHQPFPSEIYSGDQLYLKYKKILNLSMMFRLNLFIMVFQFDLIINIFCVNYLNYLKFPSPLRLNINSYYL